MSKANKFRKYKFIFSLIADFFGLFPKSFNQFFLKIFRNFPTKLGIIIRYGILKNLCLKLGENVIIFESVIFDAPQMMEIGDNVSINSFCYLAGEITIGNDVSIAHTTAMHSFNHKWDNLDLPIKYNDLYSNRIFIENDVWIGCNCVILAGVKIGGRTVVAAGALVNKSIENNSLVGGNPARLIKKI